MKTARLLGDRGKYGEWGPSIQQRAFLHSSIYLLVQKILRVCDIQGFLLTTKHCNDNFFSIVNNELLKEKRDKGKTKHGISNKLQKHKGRCGHHYMKGS